MPENIVEIQLLDTRFGKTFALPAYATAGAAGIDLRACVDTPITLTPNMCILIGTGVAIHLADSNLAGLILPRSGLGHKGLVLGNGVGLIDSDYQGEIKLSCWNRSLIAIDIQPGDRIAQLVIVPIARPTFQIVDRFSDATPRGVSGFGHSGTT